MTVAPKTLVGLQAKLVKNLHTTNLGIVGDASHVRSGGYHIGAKSLRANGMSNDYSLQFGIDRNDKSDNSCAIDIGGSASTLMTLGNRIVHALKNHDPRVYGRVRGVNAPYDGVVNDRRYDTEDPTKEDSNTQASSDRNHVHIEIYRTLVTNQKVIDDLYNVLAGVPLVPPAPHKPGQPYVRHAWPLAARPGYYFGLLSGPKNSLGGNTVWEKSQIALIKQRLHDLGYGGMDLSNHTFGSGTLAAVKKFQSQHAKAALYRGRVYKYTWNKLFTY